MSTDRLDRVEALLATVAESNAASAARLDRIEESNAASTERLDRTEALQAQTEANLARTEKIVESNARAIEAWSSRIEEGIAEVEEVRSSTVANTNRPMEDAIADTVQMIADLGRQQQEPDQRFEVFLAEARADRAEMQAAREQADLDRALTESEHRAFRETFQTMLAQIAQLWQRVAGCPSAIRPKFSSSTTLV